MKKLISMLIFCVVLVSLCSELPIQLPFSLPEISTGLTQGVATIDNGSPDIFVNVETPSSEIRSGRSIQVFFELRNKQLYDLENVGFEVYDHPCFDVASNADKFDVCPTCPTKCGSGGTLRANQSCMWSWRWASDSSNIDRTCPIKFKISYGASNSIYQDIAILPEVEYNQREVSGTLNDIPIQSTLAKGPLQVYLTFSESQPFIANQQGYSMYINYNNVGDGFFADEANDINLDLTAPDNMQDLSCDGYDPISGTSVLHLAESLKFIKGRSVPTICSFDTPQTSTISIRSLKIDIDYKYTLYGSFPVTVRGS